MEQKLPPQNIGAEQSILGALLIDQEAIAKVAGLLSADSFYRPAHGIIFATITELFEKHEPIDMVTVSNKLKEKGQLTEVGDVNYLADLIESTPTSANIEYYAKLVESKFILRQLISAGSRIVEHAFDEDRAVEDVLDQCERAVLDVAQNRQKEGFVRVKDILMPVMDRIEAIYDSKNFVMGVPSGYQDLDALTSGFQKSDLIILAARPSMGKTALALNFAANAAIKHGKHVAIFSCEMSKESLVQRMLCTEGKIDASKLRGGQLHDHEWKHLTRALGKLSESHLYIDDTPAISPIEVKAKSRRMQTEMGLDLIIIDYLQLMRGGKSRVENRNQEISELVRNIKSIARELEIPVICLSQLSRAVEQRTNKQPMLSDLRESGEIEQTADLVLFIHREDYYDQAADRANTADIIIAKQRNGPTGTVELTFRKEFTRFDNKERIYANPEEPQLVAGSAPF